jgi:PAS domain S-box-containing protein
MDLETHFLRNPEIGFLIDPAGVIQVATAGAERALDYGPGEFRGLNLPGLDEGNGLRALLARPVTSRWNLDLVMRLRAKSGKVLTSRAVAAPLIGEAGDHHGWMVWAQDIVEGFDQARGGRTILDALLDSIGAAFWSFDAGGTVLTWGPACESAFGRSRAEAEGRLSVETLFASPEEFRRVTREVDEKGRFSGEAVLAGRPFHLSVTRLASPSGGSLLGYTVVSFDLSDRKRAEEFQRALFAQAGEAMVVVDLASGRIVDCNDKMCEIHGYRRDEILGLGIIDLTATADMDHLRVAMGKILEEDGQFTDDRAVHRRKDGTLFPCEINVRVMKVAGDRFTIGIIRDLTEKHRAAEFFRVLFEKSADGAYLVEDEGLRIVEVNDAICGLLGYTRPEMLALTVRDITPVAFRDRIESVRHSVKVERPFERIRRGLQRKDGQVVPTDHMISRMEFGGKIYYLASARDVTEQVLTERALEESRALLEKFRDEAPDPMYILDGDGRFQYINASGCRALGVPREEVAGKSFADITPPDRLELNREMFHRAMRGETVRFRTEVFGAGGTRLAIEINGGPLWVGGRPGTMGVARPIADQIQAEEGLSLYREVLAHANDAIVIVDPRGVILEQNDAHRKLLGYADEEVVGKTPQVFASSYRASMEEVGERGQFRGEIVNRTRDGRDLTVEMSLFPVRDAAGEVRCLVALKHDVTERKRAEEQLRAEVAERRRAEAAARESEEKWQLLVRNAPDQILTLDRAGTILFLNRTLAGFEMKDVLGASVFQFVDPAYHAAARERLEKLFESGESQGMEVEGFGANLGKVWYSIRVSPILHEGKVVSALGIVSDVTERRRSEEKIAALAEEMGLLLANAQDFLYRHDAQGVFTYVSPSVEQITGYTPRECMRQFSEFLTENPANRRVHELAGETLRTGKQNPPYTIEVRRKDGRIILLEVNERAVWEGGKVAGIVGVARDVTERHRVERLAAAHHAVTQVLAETDSIQEALPRILHALGSALGWSMVAYWEVDAEAGVLRCARLWCEPSRPVDETAVQKVALRPGQWLPGRVWARGAPLWVTDLAREKDGAVAVKAGLHAAFAFPVRGASGILGVVELLRPEAWDPDPELPRMTDTLGGQISQFIERKRAEEALRFQKALLESQSEAAIDGILVLSTAGQVVSYNNRFLAMWDMSGEVVRDRRETSVLNFILGKVSDPEGFLRRVRYIEEHADQETRDEVPLKDGRTFERYIAPVRSLDGTNYGRVLFFRDVTGRRRAEEGLRRAVEDARRAYEDLKQAQVQLIRSEKLASIGMLVSGVAHEINNPLNVIYGNLRLLEEGGTPAARVKRMLRDALKGAEHARRIVEDFRNFARDTRTAEPVDLNRCLEETLTILGRQLPPEVKVERKPGRLPLVRGFRGQLNQVFLNLVKNAAEAIEGKGKITVRTMRRKGVAVVEVADTGRGMPPDVQKKIFEPFFSTKPVGKGLGLGLSISATIVHNHGGQITVRSRVGRGTVFRVEFPIKT